MAVFVEYVARPVPARGRARLVAEQPGAKGKAELGEMLWSLGLGDHERLMSQSGHTYASITPIDVVRAMHAGAVPVERRQIDALLRLGRVPVETQDRASDGSYAGIQINPV